MVEMKSGIRSVVVDFDTLFYSVDSESEQSAGRRECVH